MCVCDYGELLTQTFSGVINITADPYFLTQRDFHLLSHFLLLSHFSHVEV